MGTEIKDSDKKSIKLRILGFILKGYASCFRARGLAHIVKCSSKCFEITKETGFITLRTKALILIYILRIPAILMSTLIIYFKLLEGDYLFVELGIIKSGFAGLAKFSTDMDENKKLIDALIPNERFISNLVSTYLAIHVVLLMNFIGIKLIEGFHPLIKMSRKIKEIFVSKGWSLEESEHFLYAKTGILVEIPKAEGKTIVNDGILWRDLDRIPKDPIECPRDRKVVFIGNGFKLSKVEFKVK